MSVLDHAIWWQVYPLGATGAPIREQQPEVAPIGAPGQHRLAVLENWLDYVVELGCSGVLLGPIFASTSHGYDTVDHFRLDPRLGEEADFDHFVAEAHRRGLLIMLDGVFNHLGVLHPAVQAGEGEPGFELVRRSGPQRLPVAWEGHGDLALLDHRQPAVADLVTEVMLHWLRRGVAGWRLDVAYAVPSEFWRQVLARVRAEFADAVFLGEVIHGDYPAIAAAGTLDSVTQYELWKASWSSINDANFWELAWALERHAEFSTSLVAQTFAGNHDVTRIASQVGEAGAVAVTAIVMTVPGMPSVYYGDEQGFRGVKGSGAEADDALRPALPATPSQLPASGWWLYRLHQELIALRRRHPWITRAELSVEGKDNSWISYRVTGDGHWLRAQLDLDPAPQVVITVDDVVEFRWPAAP